jgi:hypothetical protein
MNGSERWHLVRPIFGTDTELLWHKERKVEEMEGQALDIPALYNYYRARRGWMCGFLGQMSIPRCIRGGDVQLREKVIIGRSVSKQTIEWLM